MPPSESPVLLPTSRICSVPLSALEVICRRAVEVALEVVGLKPTLTTHELRVPPGLAAVGATAAATGVPTQVLDRIWKSCGRSSARAVARPTWVTFSAASPVLVMRTATALAEAAVPAATDGNVVGRPSTDGLTFVPVPLRLV